VCQVSILALLFIFKVTLNRKEEGETWGPSKKKSCFFFRNSGIINPLTPELNTSSQRCLPRFLLGILIFKGLTAQRLCKSFGGGGVTL
jgi:hypothetical protein